MADDIISVPAEGEPQMVSEPGTIHFDRRFDPVRGLAKVVIETEYEARDALMALDAERTQRQWDDHISAWTANLKDLNHMAETLSDTDHSVTVAVDAAQAFESYKGGKTFLPGRRSE